VIKIDAFMFSFFHKYENKARAACFAGTVLSGLYFARARASA
jgi:hypothetical protein